VTWRDVAWRGVKMSGICPPEGSFPEWSDAMRYLGLALFLFGVVVWPPFLFMLWKRRNHPYLKPRTVELTFISCAGLFMQLIMPGLVNFLGRDNVACDLILFLSVLVIPVGIGPIVIRFLIFANKVNWQIYLNDLRDEGEEFKAENYAGKTGSTLGRIASLVKYNIGLVIAAAIRKPGSSRQIAVQGGVQGGNNSRLRQIKFFAQSGFYGVLLESVLTLSALAICIAVMVREDSPFGARGCTGCVISDQDFTYVIVIAAFLWFCVVVLLWVLRNADDPLRILRELKFVIIAPGIVALMSIILASYDVGGLRSNRSFDFFYGFSFVVHVVFYLQVIAPVMRSWELDKSSRLRRTATSSNLDEAMDESNGQLHSTFYAFLAASFCLENAIFLDAVGRFEQSADAGDLIDATIRAADIYQTFIQPGAMLEINIGSRTRSELRRSCREAIKFAQMAPNDRGDPPQITSELFRGASDEVKRLLVTDSFPRFLESSMYAQIQDNQRTGGSF